MSKVAISMSINVSEIDKARLFAGKKGKYLDCTVFINVDEADQYGNNGMITQNVSKEERDNGVKGNILGSCKVFWKEGGQQQSNFNGAPAQNNEFSDKIPF